MYKWSKDEETEAIVGEPTAANGESDTVTEYCCDDEQSVVTSTDQTP